MKVIKKINNNVAICTDQNNCELIAFGKGIGFPNMPYELHDLSLIDRTFYNLEPHIVLMLKELPEAIIKVSVDIVDKAKEFLQTNFSEMFIFTLADHISFAIKRNREGIIVQNPLIYDLKHLYTKQAEHAKWARQLINQRLAVNLPVTEESNLAMHFINAQMAFKKTEEHSDMMRIIDDITLIIEQNLKIFIDRSDFNYARFNSHLHYLIKRKNQSATIKLNDSIFQQMKAEYQDIYQCALEIKYYFENRHSWQLNSDEVMYLMLHINRLYHRRQ